MPHSHDDFTVDTAPDPEVGKSVKFTDGDTRYTLSAHHDRWLIHRFHAGGATPIATLNSRADGTWSISDVNSADEWQGETLAKALRSFLA